MTGLEPRRQRAFVEEFWEAANELETIQATSLPGRHAPAPDLNRTSFSATQLSEFDKLPQGEDFLEDVGEIPYAVIRLGRTGLLAVLNKSRTSEPLPVLAPISYLGGGLLSHPIPSFPLLFGRAEVARLYNLTLKTPPSSGN